MTDTRYDRAPGDISISAEAERRTLSDVGIYTIGLALAVILTATSFWVANTSLLWAPGISLGLVVLAIAQMGVHLVFFLHITTGPDNTNNVLALAFGILIVFLVVVGSLWIMSNLERQHDAVARADEFAHAALTADASIRSLAVSPAYDVHPEFGYLCLAPRVRRELRVAVGSLLFGMMIGAAIVTIRAGHPIETDGVSSQCATEIVGLRRIGAGCRRTELRIQDRRQRQG